MTSLAESLSRTLLLMRDEVGHEVDDSILLNALTSVRVVLTADMANIASHSAQTAFVTAAILMSRSGHQVFVAAPEVMLAAPQPPLEPGGMIEQLVKVGKNLLPGAELIAGEPDGEVDLVIAFGDTLCSLPARRRIRLNAEPWAGLIIPWNRPRPWDAALWPLGALAAAGLGAGEAFKVAMHNLLAHAPNPEHTADLFACTSEIRFELAPPDTPRVQNLGEVDFVSGGAVTQAALFCLARIPTVTAQGRIIEPEAADLTNLNRYMLLLRAAASGAQKAQDLALMLGDGLHFRAVPASYEIALLEAIAPLAPMVVVGVDDIPTRWAVQEAMPEWLVIGATTHWSALASFHREGLGCARCLHDQDNDDDATAPTTACVSFWAGLLSAAYLARHAGGSAIPVGEQQIYLTPFRPENPFRAAVAVREGCPTCRRPAASAVA